MITAKIAGLFGVILVCACTLSARIAYTTGVKNENQRIVKETGDLNTIVETAVAAATAEFRKKLELTIQRLGVAVSAWETHRNFSELFNAYRGKQNLMDDLERILIKRHFGIKLPDAVENDWRPKRQALEQLADETLDGYEAAKFKWHDRATAVGITASFDQARKLDLANFLRDTENMVK